MRNVGKLAYNQYCTVGWIFPWKGFLCLFVNNIPQIGFKLFSLSTCLCLRGRKARAIFSYNLTSPNLKFRWIQSLGRDLSQPVVFANQNWAGRVIGQMDQQSFVAKLIVYWFHIVWINAKQIYQTPLLEGKNFQIKIKKKLYAVKKILGFYSMWRENCQFFNHKQMMTQDCHRPQLCRIMLVVMVFVTCS